MSHQHVSECERSSWPLLARLESVRRPLLAVAPFSVTSAHVAGLLLLQFNLEVDEVQSAARELDAWRRQITLPLVLEVGWAFYLDKCSPPQQER